MSWGFRFQLSLQPIPWRHLWKPRNDAGRTSGILASWTTEDRASRFMGTTVEEYGIFGLMMFEHDLGNKHVDIFVEMLDYISGNVEIKLASGSFLRLCYGSHGQFGSMICLSPSIWFSMAMWNSQGLRHWWLWIGVFPIQQMGCQMLLDFDPYTTHKFRSPTRW